ncbi:MAG TPA: hypothetical protein VEB59_10255 [Gemmatimonadales bacterium]|nr:hypothetical protein [Gemmatimonadales bacterium]
MLGYLLVAACSMAPAGAPIPLEGPAPEMEALAGTWTGRYWSDRGQGGGHGSIEFRLEPGNARGRVEMHLAPGLRHGDDPEQHLARRTCTTIDIEFVRLDAGGLRGTLAPYWSPECDCRVLSVFEGRRDGHRITGTFLTRREGGGQVESGRWLVERATR